MHIGDFIDVIVYSVVGIGLYNVLKKNEEKVKEKYGDKGKWLKYGALGFILLAVLRIIAIVLK